MSSNNSDDRPEWADRPEEQTDDSQVTQDAAPPAGADGGETYACPDCPETFSGPDALEQRAEHVEAQHLSGDSALSLGDPEPEPLGPPTGTPDPAHGEGNTIEDEIPEPKTPEENTLECPTCGTKFSGPDRGPEYEAHFEEPCHKQAWAERNAGDRAEEILRELSDEEATSRSGVDRVIGAGSSLVSLLSASKEGSVWSIGKYTLDIDGFRTKGDDETLGRTTLLSTTREQLAFAIGYLTALTFIVATLASLESVAAVATIAGAALSSARATQRAFDAEGRPLRKRFEYAIAEPITALIGVGAAVISVLALTVLVLLTDVPPEQLVDRFFDFVRLAGTL